MSLKFYDEPSLTSLRTYDSIAQIFDPRVNKMAERVAPFSVRQFLQILKALYTPENLKVACGLFNQNMCDYLPSRSNPDRFDAIYGMCDEDDLWALYFTKWRGIEFGQHILNFTTPDRARTHRGSTTVISAEAYNAFTGTAVAFAEKMKQHAALWMETLTPCLDKPIATSNSWGPDCVFTGVLKLFLDKDSGYTDANGNVSSKDYSWIQRASSPGTKVVTVPDNAMVLDGQYFNLCFSQKIDKDNRDPLYKILSYSANPCNMLEWPLTAEGEHNPTLYGVELECSFDYKIKEVIDAAAIPFFIAKADSTVNGRKNTKAELVTVPMSLKAHKKHWAHWFKNLDYSRFDCTNETNNGMHVHIDRKAFDDQRHIRNMAWFYLHPANTDFLVYVSERGSLAKMQSYTPIAQFSPSLSKVKAYKRSIDTAQSCRGIVNFGKPATVEIRMFRGIVSFAELVKNLEFVDAVLHFTKGEQNINTLTINHFISWLQKTPSNRYQVLKQFLKGCKRLDQLSLACEINNEVFNVKDPEKMAEILNKSRLTITNAHVTYLNKGRKRTFVLDKVTGHIQVLQNNLSKLASLDRSIEAKYTRHLFAA